MNQVVWFIEDALKIIMFLGAVFKLLAIGKRSSIKYEAHYRTDFTCVTQEDSDRKSTFSCNLYITTELQGTSYTAPYWVNLTTQP